jgi:predicted O-methyltransferase YrrM
MNKLQKFFKSISLIVRKPYLLNKVLEDDTRYKTEVQKKYNLPHGLPTINCKDIFGEQEITVSPFSLLDGTSWPIDIALLKALAMQFDNCEYLEIGTWRGESVANLAQVSGHCTTINLPDDEMRKMGLDENYIKLHRCFSHHLKNVTHVQANSINYDFKTLNKKFDLIFVDGDHHYAGVKNDTQKVFELLRNENSVIVWHDYGKNPEHIRWDVLLGILDGTPKDCRKNIYRVSNTLCAIYTKADFKTYFGQYPATPDKVFSVNIKINSSAS